jgi:hypothetical protein
MDWLGSYGKEVERERRDMKERGTTREERAVAGGSVGRGRVMIVQRDSANTSDVGIMRG